MAIIILFVILLSYLCYAEVFQLEESNFDEHTSDGLWYLEFYAPWCGHCKKFAPIYEEASNDAALKNVNFGVIDATSQKKLAKRFDVSRFPTIKFFENEQEYKYSGARTYDSLKTEALKMLEPVIKDLSIQSFNQFNNRFTVSFLHIINDKNSHINPSQNRQIYEKAAMKFRPSIPFYCITFSDLKRFLKNKTFITNSLRFVPQQTEHKFTTDGGSILFAITPSINNVELNGALTVSAVQEFIEMNRYSPIIQLKLGIYKDLVQNTKYFGLVFVDGNDEELDMESNKLIDEAETLVINNKQWNMDSFERHKEWKRNTDKMEQVLMYKVLFAWCNFTEYEEWAAHQFGVKMEHLPVMLVYSAERDGYWRYDGEGGMLPFLNDVFGDKLEITYTRNWIARKAMKLERWLNDLSGWQIALVFVSVFVCLCGIMVLLDYCCSPSQQLHND